MLSFRQPVVSHNVRSNTDQLKLEPKLELNFVKSQVMFCFAAPEGWNVLPIFVRVTVFHSLNVVLRVTISAWRFAMLMTFEHGLNINT